MKKFSIPLLLLVLLSVVLTGCEQETSSGTPALIPVYISISTDKGISLTQAEGEGRYQYKAIAKGGFIRHGEVSEWKDINFDSGKAQVGDFSQGMWTFYVRELDEEYVTYEGSAEYDITNCSECTVPITMTRKFDGGNVTVNLSINCPCFDSETYSLNCLYKKVEDSSYLVKDDWNVTDLGSSKQFNGELVLSEGSYVFNFVYYRNGVQIGGETLSAEIAGGREQSIQGDLKSIISKINGEIINSNLQDKEISAKEMIDFVWQSNGGTKSYKWYINDVLQEGFTAASFSFTEKTSGVYIVKCVTSDGETAQCKITVIAEYFLQVSLYNLAKLMENSGVVCKGFKPVGAADSEIITTYPYTAKCSSETYTSLSDLGLQAVVVTTSDEMLNSETLIISKNANTLEGSRKNWLGMYITQKSTTLKTVYTFKNPITNCLTGMTGLTRIYLMDGIETLAESAFFSLTALEEITLPDTLKSIGSSAFKSCSSLKKIHIPSSVEKVGSQIFDHCDSLSSVTTGYPAGSSRPSDWAEDWFKDCTGTARDPFR